MSVICFNGVMEQLKIVRVQAYTPELAKSLAELMGQLSDSYVASEVPKDRLEVIIASPDRMQLIAELHGQLVGAATLTLIAGIVATKVWLDDFIVSEDESVRGKGVGYALWNEMLAWGREKGASSMQFTSKPTRIAAQKFYERQGARKRDSIPFKIDL